VLILRNYRWSSPRPPSWPLWKGSRESGGGFLLSFLCEFFGALYRFWAMPGQRAKGSYNGILRIDQGRGRTVDGT